MMDTAVDIVANLQKEKQYKEFASSITALYDGKTKWTANSTPLDTSKIVPQQPQEVNGQQVKELDLRDWVPTNTISWSLAGYVQVDAFNQMPSNEIITNIREEIMNRVVPDINLGWCCEVVKAIVAAKADAINFASATSVSDQAKAYLAANPTFLNNLVNRRPPPR